MTDNLDEFLSQPLTDVPDNGFSNRMAALLEVQRLRRERVLYEIYAGLVLLAVMVLPFTAPGRMIAAALLTQTGMALTGVAIAVLVLAWRLKRPAHFCLTA